FAERVHAPVPPSPRGELVEQLRPEAIQVLAQPRVGDERQRFPLAGRRHGDERRPAIGVAAMIAGGVRPRQVLGRHERRVPALEQQVSEAAPELGVAGARGPGTPAYPYVIAQRSYVPMVRE